MSLTWVGYWHPWLISVQFSSSWGHTLQWFCLENTPFVSGTVCWGVLLTSHIHRTAEGINLSWQTTLYLFKFASLFLHSMQIQPGGVSDPPVLKSSLDIFFQKAFTFTARKCSDSDSLPGNSIFTWSFNRTCKSSPGWLFSEIYCLLD